jgi:methyl-accepting chemotaxis protein
MMKKFKLSTKLWGLSGLLLAAVLAVTLNSVWSISGILESNNNYVDASEFDTFITQKEVDHLTWVNRVKDLFVEKLDHTDVQIDHTKCGLGKFLYGEKNKELIAGYPALGSAVEAIKQPHKHLHTSADMINKTVKKHGHEEAHKVFLTKTLPALSETQKGMKALADKLHDMKESSKNKMVSTGSNSQWSAVVVTAIAFLLGGLLSAFVIRSITKPVKRIIDGLNEGADQVASASSQVSSASQELAEGSSEQAASIEETSSSLEEMSSMTKQNAEHAGQADNLMQETNQVVNHSAETMNQLTSSMEEISTASEETSKIIKTIDEIAFQTNLLALNAAVEAARAGEAGAGFAVVADEVRNLAMRAAEAARNTADLIEGTVKKVRDGSDLVNRTNEAFIQVAESSSKVGDLVGEIAAASNEQAQGIEQVNTAVAEMDKVTQRNAANAEESASASEEMSAQAEQMKAIVGEMVALVGAGGNGVENGEQVSVENAHAGNQSDPAAAAPIKKVKSVTAESRSAKEVSPENMIPFGDADLQDF